MGSLTFGDKSISSAGGFDTFVAKFDSVGSALWAKSAGGASDDYCYSIAIAPDESIVLGGFFSGLASFDSVGLISDGGGDVFVAKLR